VREEVDPARRREKETRTRRTADHTEADPSKSTSKFISVQFQMQLGKSPTRESQRLRGEGSKLPGGRREPRPPRQLEVRILALIGLTLTVWKLGDTVRVSQSPFSVSSWTISDSPAE
jgi:hypothetical protein